MPAPKDYSHLLSTIENAETDNTKPYHHGDGYRHDKRGRGIPVQYRTVVAVDGEGLNADGDPAKNPQRYVMFGWAMSNGDEGAITRDWLNAEDILGCLFKIEAQYPDALYVAYGFKYDMQQIAQRLAARYGNAVFRILHEKKMYSWRGLDGYSYFISKFHLGKTFTVSRYWTKGGRESGYATVTIFDIVSYFAKPFVGALKEFGIGDPQVIEEIIVVGKTARGTQEDTAALPEMRDYMMHEVRYLVELFQELRDRAIAAELVPTLWHGPASLASVMLKREGVRALMSESPPAVHDAALRAYVGGRFENPLLGRIVGPIYAYDINSAYPAATRLLPSLTSGEWVHSTNPRTPAKFGVYHVLVSPTREQMLTSRLGPLAHRDSRSNITYPWINDTWCWSPEAFELLRLSKDKRYKVEIIEGWELRGAEYGGFEFVQDIYDKRRAMKDTGDPAQIVLKLALNSMYGKFAQRVGWDEEKRRAPAYHQIEWAGYITSWCRAQIFALSERVRKLGYRTIAIETDGLYTDAPPELVGIKDSHALGEWEVTQFDEIMYLQSGVYQALDPVKGWVFKTRGIERGDTDPEALATYMRTLRPNPTHEDPWGTFTSATRSRYVGIGTALMRKGSPLTYVGRWEPYAKEIQPGRHGKRMHLPPYCSGCAAGASAYEAPHELVIRSNANADHPESARHSLPWMGDDTGNTEPWWREKQDTEKGDLIR